MPRTGGIYSVPVGTDAVTNTTISSVAYNSFLRDLEGVVGNEARPVSVGGTGAVTAAAARTNLGAEVAMQTVTDYNTHAWETGSFKSGTGALNSPDGAGAATSAYTGTVQIYDSNNAVVTAFNYSTKLTWRRSKNGGVWGAWVNDSGSDKVAKAGDTMSGALIVTPKGSQFGTAGGTAATGAVVPADANFKFYDFSGGNWAGMGVDSNGSVWLRTGTAAGAAPALYADANRIVYTNQTLKVGFGAGGSLSIRGGASQHTTITFENNAGTAMGYCYYDITNDKMSFTHVSGAVPFAHTSASVCYLGRGFVGRAGLDGAYGSNTFNLNWGSGPALYVDNTNLGNIAFTCDYRTKRDVQPLDSTWNAVKALNPISFKYKDYGETFKGSDDLQWGFVAHELQETLLPSAATGSKDEENLLQSPNWLAIIAALTKALQEAMARIEALEEKA